MSASRHDLPRGTQQPAPVPSGDTALLTALLDGMDVGLCALAADGTVTHWNQEAERILGWPAEEAVGRPGFAGWAAREADAEEVGALLLAAAEDGERHVLEFPLRTKDGRRVLLRGQTAAVPAPGGRPPGVYCAFSEAYAQVELERSLALAEALFDDAPWGVLVLDADLRPAVLNDTAARLLGTGQEDALGRPLGELLRAGLEDVEGAAGHVLAEGVPRSPVELWVEPAAGDVAAPAPGPAPGRTRAAEAEEDGEGCGRRCWRGSFLRLGSPLGLEPVPLGVAWLFADVTEERRAEREAARARFRAGQLRRAAQAAAECEDALEAAAVQLEFALAGFADHALVDVLDGERLLRVAATPPGAVGSDVPEEPAGLPVRYSEWHPVRQAVQRRGPVRATAGRPASADAGRQAAWARARRWPEGTVHALCTVLRSRGRTIGVVTFLRGASRHPFDRADTAYAEDVALRVAAAVDLARTGG
ncbi:PAS domain-containing protein [Streptomyces capparidis]